MTTCDNTPQEPRERPAPSLRATIKQISDYETLFAPPPQPFKAVRYRLLEGLLYLSQRRLQKHSHGWQHREMTLSYLRGRGSLCFHSNVCHLIENDPNVSNGCSRAAQLILRALVFRDLVVRGQLPLEIEKSTALDQSFYHAFFGCIRLPGIGQDSVQMTRDSQHLIVACRGEFFKVSGVTGIPTLGELERILTAIVAEARPQTHDPGLWTTLPREKWARLRIKLLKDPSQAELLDTITTAILWVALDLDDHPQNNQESVRLLTIDRYGNRWFDRSQQLIVFGNGVAGLNRDHTLLDGHLSLFYLEYLSGHRSVPHTPHHVNDREPTLKYQSLSKDYRLPLDRLDDYHRTLQLWENTRKSFNIEVWDDPLVHQKFCRRHQISPDFVIQAALHLACYQAFGAWQSISEAVHMRHTLGGRYDTILTLTKTIQNLVLKIVEAEKSGFDGDVRAVIRTDFYGAQASHRQLIRRCKEGSAPLLHMVALIQNVSPALSVKVNRDGIRILGGIGWHPLGLIKSLFCDVTTSHPGYRPGFEMVGFTDTELHVIGVAYLVKERCTSIFLKGDHLKREAAIALAPMLKASLKTIVKVFEI